MASIQFGDTTGSRPFATLDVVVTGQNLNDNTSSISFTLTLHKPSRISSSASKNWSVTVDGQTWSGSGSIGGTGTQTLLTGSKTITHNTDGTKSISFSASIGINITWSGSWIGTISGSGSMGLNTIVRGADITLFNCNSSYLDGTFTIKYNPKATYTYYLRLSVPNIKQIVRISLGTQGVGEKTITYKFTNTELLNIYTTTPNNANVPIGAVIECYNGATKITESSEPTITLSLPTNIVPTINSQDILEGTPNLNTKFGGYVKTKSTLKVVINATGVNGSTIKSYSTKIDGVTYTSSSFTSQSLNSSGTVAVITTVTDSRGRTATKTTNITVYDYFIPSITAFTVNRALASGELNEEGTRAKFIFTYDIAPVNNKNDKDIKIQYLNGSNWITLITLSNYSANEQTYLSTIDFTIDSAFEFRLVINDYFINNSEGIKKTMSPSFSLINWNASGRSMSFGKPSARGVNEKVIDFAIPIYDLWEKEIRNGIADYSNEGIDANETLEEIALCSKNIPYNQGLAYVRTIFNGSKTITTPRTQIAYPYTSGHIATRQYVGEDWTEWQLYAKFSGSAFNTFNISGSIVKTVNAGDSVVIHTFEQIQQMFETVHKVTPDNQTFIGVIFTNGDGVAHTQHFEGPVWLGNELYCTWNGLKTGTVRVNYCYIYNQII